ncbi:hypothetical protein BC827DRAFT_1151791 [Russula dissimulans]|nr:hypothetical protein BC827DRAFT_1151791 [Russula dissimulans]
MSGSPRSTTAPSSSGTPSATREPAWYQKGSTIEAPAEETQGSQKGARYPSITFEVAASWKGMARGVEKWYGEHRTRQRGYVKPTIPERVSRAKVPHEHEGLWSIMDDRLHHFGQRDCRTRSATSQEGRDVAFGSATRFRERFVRCLELADPWTCP